MDLKQWVENGWLCSHRTSKEEIGNLLLIAERDLKDATGGISDDWRFGIAYNAALKLCTILLYAQGYKAERQLQHYRTIQSLPLILGEDRRPDAAYLDTCRAKRNIVEYDYIGAVTEQDADELISFARELKTDVIGWLRQHHPELKSVRRLFLSPRRLLRGKGTGFSGSCPGTFYRCLNYSEYQVGKNNGRLKSEDASKWFRPALRY